MSTEKLPTVRVVAAVVGRDGRYLVTQRRPSAVLPLLWEFPGGRVEPGETDAQALAREFEGRLAAPLRVGGLISYVRHSYVSYVVELYLYECELCTDSIDPVGVHAVRWVRSEEFDSLDFTPADEASMNALLGEDR